MKTDPVELVKIHNIDTMLCRDRERKCMALVI